MRVRVAYTATVDDDYRRALRHSWGECGTLATREEVRNALIAVGQSNDADLIEEWQECERCQAGREERQR